MAKFYEIIGFSSGTEEIEPGIWVDSMSERYYYGDIIRTSRKLNQNNNINAEITLDMSISIIADDFALASINKIRYVKWMGSKWQITSIDNTQRPRLILTIGGIYNG